MLRSIRVFLAVLLAVAGVVVCQEAVVPTPAPSYACEPDFMGDGYCDKATNNVEECDYDGGDCCECTCVSLDAPYDCHTFECSDPTAECFNDTPSPSATPEPTNGDDDETMDHDGSVLLLPMSTGTVLGLAAFWLAVLNRSAWEANL